MQEAVKREGGEEMRDGGWGRDAKGKGRNVRGMKMKGMRM